LDWAIVRDGKLLREFERFCDMLHIVGYYRGLPYDRGVLDDALKAARIFIDQVGPS
jgi:hypothetical protein